MKKEIMYPAAIQKFRCSGTLTYLIPLLLITGVLLILKEALHEVEKTQTPIGFAIDDAWIHASLAKSLIEHEGFGINPGEWVPASTAPAWTLLLALTMSIFKDPVISGLVCATFCQSAAVVLMYLLMMRFTGHRFWSMVTAMLLPLNPVLLWGFPSGMEHPVVILSVLTLFFVFEVSNPDSRLRIIGIPVCMIFCALSRPELLVLVPAGMAATFCQNYKGSRESFLKGMYICFWQGVIFGLGMLPYFLINYTTTGHLFPTAFFVKAQLREVGVGAALDHNDTVRVLDFLIESSTHEFVQLVIKFLHANPFLLLLAPLGMTALVSPGKADTRGRIFLLFTLTVLLPLCQGALVPTHNFSNYANRYMTPYVPGFIILQGLGMWYLWKMLRQPGFAVIFLFLGILFSSRTFLSELRKYAHDVKNTNQLYVDAGKWIHDELAPDVTLAVNDIGAISYFAHHQMVDVMGLASPEIWPYLEKSNRDNRLYYILDYMHAQRIDYLIVSPRYYHGFNAVPGLFEEIHVWNTAFPTFRLIDPQILYHVNWEKFPAMKAAFSIDNSADISG